MRLTKNAQPGKLCIFCRNVFRLALCRFVPRRRGVLLFRSVLCPGAGQTRMVSGPYLFSDSISWQRRPKISSIVPRPIYGAVFALRLVVVGDHGGLRFVDVDPVADHPFVTVVGTAALLAAQQQAFDQFLVGHLERKHDAYRRTVLLHDFVEGFGPARSCAGSRRRCCLWRLCVSPHSRR